MLRKVFPSLDKWVWYAILEVENQKELNFVKKNHKIWELEFLLFLKSNKY